jgi:hypothetical protein
VNSSCCSFPSKDIFVSEPLCAPFSKEFLSDFLYSDNAHPVQESFGAHQELANPPAVGQSCENAHRPADPQSGVEETSNRISTDLGNYWLYHHREHVVWKEEDQTDACASNRRNSRPECVPCRTYDLSTKRLKADDSAQSTSPSRHLSNVAFHEPQHIVGSSVALTVDIEAPSEQKPRQSSLSRDYEQKQERPDFASKGSSKRSRSNAPAHADFEYSTVNAVCCFDILSV